MLANSSLRSAPLKAWMWSLLDPSVKTILFQDAAFPVRRDQKLAEARIRVVARPERPVAELLARLDLELPTRTKIIRQVETSAFQILQQTVPETKM